MPREGYTGTTLDNDLAKELDGLGLRKRAEGTGGKWKRPDVIRFLLEFYKKHGTTNNVNKEIPHETTRNKT